LLSYEKNAETIQNHDSTHEADPKIGNDSGHGLGSYYEEVFEFHNELANVLAKKGSFYEKLFCVVFESTNIFEQVFDGYVRAQL
jgi:hypothetical protein